MSNYNYLTMIILRRCRANYGELTSLINICIRPAVPEGKTYPGAELILTPPATPEPVLIDEGMVSSMLNEYKSHFPTDTSESRKRS